MNRPAAKAGSRDAFVAVLFGVLEAIGTAGCATPYQESGVRGGYEDLRVGPAQFYVAVKGNGFTGETTLVSHFHQRARELCQSIGFSAYAFNSSSETRTERTPSTYTAETQSGILGSTTTVREHPGIEITKHGVKGYVSCHTPFAAVPQPMVMPAVQTRGIQPPPQTAPARQISMNDAQRASVLLNPGMGREDIVKVLGLPTNTESQTAGQNTGKPWQALIWNYVWEIGDGRRRILALTLESANGTWVLNSWHWW